MKLPIRDQILWPLMGLLLMAVAANVIFSAWWISIRNRSALSSRQRQIIGVLEESSFPLSKNVLEKLQRLTGDELIIWDCSDQRIVLGTLPANDPSGSGLSWDSDREHDAEAQYRTVYGKPYLVRAGRIRGNPSQRLLVMTPDEMLRKGRREVIWPPIAVGLATIVCSIPLTLLLASIWARRIRSLERHVESIAHGQFGLELPEESIDDELSRLVESINSMSRQLLALREKLIQGERTRLVAQLAAGFAHQLRNGLAGAKLAIQLHESRCVSTGETSLNVARNQLALVEEEVQGLLSLGKGDSRPPSSVDLEPLIESVRSLVSLSCEHKGVELTIRSEGAPMPVIGYPDGLRSAVLNLTLNAIDAAGPGGHVWLTQKSESNQHVVMVEDDGSGPPAAIAESLYESFVTSKPEGIGLGLTVAATVARTHNGSLCWSRVNERTRFELVLPHVARLNEGDA